MRRIVIIFGLVPLVLALAAVAALGAGRADGPAAPGQRGTVWVVNRALNDIAAFEPATGDLLAVVGLGKEPNGVTVANGKVYVSEEGANAIAVLDAQSFAVLKRTPSGPKPHHIQSSRNGQRVVFGVYGTNRVGVIDTATDTLVELATSSSAAARTHAPFPSRDGKTVYVTNEVTNEIAAVDVATGAIELSVLVGNRPSEILVTPDEKTAYVSVRNENKLKVIDLGSRAITAELVVGTQPDTLQLSPGGKSLVVALRGQPAQVVVVDTSSLSVAATITIGGAGTTAAHQWSSASGRYTYAAFEGPAAGVAVIDHRSNEVVATYPYPGGGKPHGLHYADSAATHGPVLALAGRALAVRGGSASVELACKEQTALRCTGRVALVLRSGRELGSKAFSTASGETEKAELRLVPRTQETIRRGGTIHGRLRIVATDGIGNTTRLSWPVALGRRSSETR